MNWRNAQGLHWNGRQLSNATFGAAAAIDFSYNADGIRTEKYYFNHETPCVHRVKYILDGTKILAEMCEDAVAGETRTLYYFYDEKGDVAGFEYNGDAYFYQKNIQGDVLRICNEGGWIVAEYTYDAWGKVLSVADANGNAITSETHVANLNPFRYRSYYYDTETGFYYLNSRYYDPEVGRFLNADGIVGANGGITGYNLFAYCSNNPVIHYDPTGEADMNCLLDRSLEISNPGRKRSGIGGAIGEAIDEAITTDPPSNSGPIFYGADRLGGTWKIVTPPMSYEKAFLWIMKCELVKTYGKGAIWGLYTEKMEDALLAVVLLGGPVPAWDPPEVGKYPHFHVNGRTFMGKYEHFHIWYGEMG